MTGLLVLAWYFTPSQSHFIASYTYQLPDRHVAHNRAYPHRHI
jgi:hypothetical protein